MEKILTGQRVAARVAKTAQAEIHSKDVNLWGRGYAGLMERK